MRESMPEVQFPPLSALEFITFDNPGLDLRSRCHKVLNLSQMRSYRLFPVNASVYLGENFDRLFVVVACIVNDKCLKEFGGT